MEYKELIKSLSRGLFQWYPFKAGENILLAGKSAFLFKEIIDERGGKAKEVDFERTIEKDWIAKHRKTFDIIICVTEIETASEPSEVLRLWREILKDTGRIFLGIHNRLGFKYFCGDKEPYTKRICDGLDGYREIKREKMRENKWRDLKGRCYSLAEIKDIIKKADWTHIRAYSIFPDIWCPQLIYAENYLPKEALTSRYFPVYNDAESVFLEEKGLLEQLLENDMFHQTANAYLIEISEDGGFADMNHVTLSMDRGPELATYTLVTATGTVEKCAAYREGVVRLSKIIEHKKYLEAHNVRIIDTEWKDNRLVMPYIEGELASVYLGKLLRTNVDEFLRETDRFVEIVKHSSDLTDDKDGGILERGYADLVPLNSFYIDGDFYFFDQEFCFENYPIKAIVERIVSTLYVENVNFESILPIDALRERYGLTDNIDKWVKMEGDFFRGIKKDVECEEFQRKHTINYNTFKENRRVINGDWRNDSVKITRQRDRFNYQIKLLSKWVQLLQRDAKIASYFVNRREKNIVIYGAAVLGELLAREIMKFPELNVKCFLDRNAEKIKEKSGVPVYTLEDWDTSEKVDIVVVTAVTGTDGIIQNVTAKNPDIAVVSVETIIDDIENEMRYDENCKRLRSSDASPRSEEVLTIDEERFKPADKMSKPYRIGYVAGVFDLFHIGHLNLLRRAKEHCDYLIVGVVSDRQVRENKKVEPFIPFNERLDMVRSCKFVDEAHEIPFETPDTDMAWKLYRFDAQFSGSDYEKDPAWLAKQKWLRERGADMVFFPYTETTSSTRLKKLIEERLI